jgi:hypothetical protein
LGDAVALQAEWGPARILGDSNVRALVSVNPRRVEFGVRNRTRSQYRAVILAALGSAAVAVIVLVSLGRTDGDVAVVAQTGIIGGLMLAGYYAARLRIATSPIVFDANRGEFWSGRRAPSDGISVRDLKQYTSLDRVHALQLVSKSCYDGYGGYASHEINLILDDATRIHLVDYRDRTRVREDGATLAAFLERPLWDATAMREGWKSG